MLKPILDNVRKNSPLVHNITNYVTVNDCANILLAIGASPIMADDIGEVEEITAICNGLNINIGTLNQRVISSMLLAGKKANQINNPVTLDPVGAGASKLRTETALKIMREINLTIIRGNISEIKTLANNNIGTTQGVDANIADVVCEDNLQDAVNLAKSFSAKTGAIIAITGAIDIVANADKAYVIRNGHPIMSRITGSGCMLSAILTASVAANLEEDLLATVMAICAMGVCGELAHKRLSEKDGNSTYRNYLIDEIYHLTGESLDALAKYQII